ncbi:MAG: hypothetical protein ACI88C_000304 [Acidimicrobiales bacterium]
MGVMKQGGITKLSCERRASFFLEIGYHDLCSLGDESSSGPFADAACGPGDNGNLVLQPHCVPLFRIP